MTAPITLAMLVGDSADTLPAVLDSIKAEINTWVLLGSKEHAECKTIAYAHLPMSGTFGYLDFSDFAAARNELLTIARNASAPGSYLLLADADEPMHGEIPHNLDADVYYAKLRDEDSSTEWSAPRLVKASADVHYVGKAHEYLEHSKYPADDLPGVYFTMPFGSGTTPERLETTRQLLETESDPRSVFYLARTYESLGRIPEAIETYQRRARMFDGFDQEQFFAAYQAGVLLMPIDVDNAIEWLLKAHYFRPSRKEPMACLVRAFKWKAQQLPPSTDNLFVNRELESELL